MHTLQTSFILGYHGCTKESARCILEQDKFEASQKDYDWLGHGVYFWESSTARAWQWAKEKTSRKTADEPAVLGAVIDLGLCLDTMTLEGCQAISAVVPQYETMLSLSEEEKPRNEPGRRHFLDCAILNFFHEVRSGSQLSEINTVRGIFHEGEPLYQGAMFYERTHSQICVRTSGSIKGIFRVRPNEKA